MKFAHLADCHIGSWREPKLRELNLKAFKEAVDICIKENTAFVLIAGDLFDTSLPSIDIIKETAAELEKLRSNDISVYIIPGSHDFSPSGKTILDVLEKAGLCENVVKIKYYENKIKLDFTLDKTNTKITGLFGKRRSLEKSYYDILDKKSLEEEKGFKIFMFHGSLDEYKPENLEAIESMSINQLPKNFDYYAGGHLHFVFNGARDGYRVIAYPGPLFPNSFLELEKLEHGNFYIVNFIDEKISLKNIPIKLIDIISFNIDVNDKTAEEAEKEILKQIGKKDVKDKLVTLRISGVLSSGKPSDINFKEIMSKLKDAYFVLKNTNKLTTKEFEEIKVETGNVEEIESRIIKEHLGQIKIKDLDENKEEGLTYDLIQSLNIEKEDGERNIDFEDRLTKDLIKVFNLKKFWKNGTSEN